MEENSTCSKFNHRHLICIVFLILVILWSVFVCSDSYVRLFYSIIDFGLGIVYAVFFRKAWCPVPAVNELKHVNVSSHFPQDFDSLSSDIRFFFDLFFSRDNLNNWLVYINPKILLFTQIIMLVLLFLAAVLFIRVIKKPHQNNKHGQETKACEMYKKLCFKVFRPFISYLKSLYSFFRSHKWYFRSFIIVFLCSINIITIPVAFLSYYFYLLGSMNFSTVVYQLYKFSVDVIIMLDTLPILVWFFIAVVVFHKLTIYFAYARLDRQGTKNMRFCDTCGIVIFIIGVMRAGKTALQTALLVFFAVKFRRMSKGIMLKVHRHFSFFPFPVYQQELLKLFKAKKIKSLASMKKYIDYKAKKFYENPCKENIFGYDYERYGLDHDDGNVICGIWDDLLKFGQAYLVFTEPTYFVANYSIREIHELKSVGNMEDWNMEIYRRPSFNGNGEYAHILDHDMLRPGKKMHPERNVYGTIEYGLIAEDEIDKERANTLELQEVKASADECNQKNDLHNQHLKMMGHGSTIDFKCFVRLFGTSQRASSWGADGKELSDVVSIDAVSEDRLALRFFNWRAMLGDFLLSLHDSSTFKSWFNRGDTSLPMYLLWQLTKPYLDYYERTLGIFGYRVLTLSRQAGTGEGEKVQFKFYDQNKLVRSGMYATDSHVSYFHQNNLKANKSFNDIERFKTLHPSYDDLAEKSNSHMYKKWSDQSNSTSKNKKSRPKTRRKD